MSTGWIRLSAQYKQLLDRSGNSIDYHVRLLAEDGFAEVGTQ